MSTLETSKPERKHAYLIMAYGNWHQLSVLLELLDDVRNDLYIHIDARVGDFPQKMLESVVREAKVFFIPRKEVYWADYSQTEVELDLMQAASERDRYHYYHLLSGMDLPLKTQNEIHRFFENETREFIAMTPNGGAYAEKHIRYYHLLLHNRFFRKCKPLKMLDRVMMYAQRLLGLKRRVGRELAVSTGWTWFSITHDFCRYAVSQRDFVEKMFSFTLASDEKFMGTLVNQYGCLDRVYHVCPEKGTNLDYIIGCQRMIDFDRPVPKPYTWGRDDTQSDFDQLMNSGCLFARKFSEQENEDIIQMIANTLKARKLEEDRADRQ